MAETPEVRLRRLHMRSIRRGIKEMDLVFTAFSESCLATLTEEELDLYERLLEENDQDILTWVTGQNSAPEIYADLIARARAAAEAKFSS